MDSMCYNLYIFPWWMLTWKHKKNTQFLYIATGVWGISGIHTHRNSGVLYQSSNKSPMKMPGNPKLQIYRNIIVNLILINVYAKSFMQTILYQFKEDMKVHKMLPVHAANSGNTTDRVNSIVLFTRRHRPLSAVITSSVSSIIQMKHPITCPTGWVLWCFFCTCQMYTDYLGLTLTMYRKTFPSKFCCQTT